MKIEKLTKEQEKKLIEYRKMGIDIGLSTKQATLEDAIKIKNSIYKFLKKKDVPVVLLRSPIEAWLAVNMFCFNMAQVRAQVRAQVGAQVRAQVGDQVGDQVRAQVVAQVRAQVGAQVRAQVVGQVSDQVWAQVVGQVWAQVRDQVGDQVRAKVSAQVWDQVRDQVSDQVWVQVVGQVWDQVRDQVGDQVGAQVRDQVGAQVMAQVRAQIWDQVRDQVGDQVGAQVVGQVWDQVRAQVVAQVSDQVKEHKLIGFIYPHFDGNFYSYYVAWYKFFKEILGLKLTDASIIENQLGVHFIYPLDNICIMSQPFVEVHKNNQGLHRDGGPAIRYSDGFSVYSLNGIRVPEWLAMTPLHELRIEQYNSIENADVKTEFVKKFGVERMVSMGKIVDTYEKYSDDWWTRSEYKLIDMSCLFEGVDYAPHLYCLNQTVPGIYHLESVHPDCKNLVDAMSFRYGKNSNEMEILNIK